MSQPLARQIPDACRALGGGQVYNLQTRVGGKDCKLVRIAGRTVVPESEIVRLASGGIVCGPICGPGG